MFSNLTLYYLNQMGITPWVKKEHSLALLNNPNTAESDVLKLVVLISSDLSDKAQSLLNRMVAYLNIEQDKLLMIQIIEQDLTNSTKHLLSQFKKSTPLAILSLGMDTNDLLSDTNLNYPIVQSLSPEYILSNPSYKRKIFQDLNYLKSLVS